MSAEHFSNDPGFRPPQTAQQKADEASWPPPLTQDQLEHFAAEARRAAAKGAREGARRQARSALLGFLILFAGISYNVYDIRHSAATSRRAIVQSGRVVSVDGCNRDYRDDRRFIALLNHSVVLVKRSIKQQHLEGTPQAKEALAFYRTEIRNATNQLPDCRKAVSVVTDDPSKPQPTIVPLHRPDAASTPDAFPKNLP